MKTIDFKKMNPMELGMKIFFVVYILTFINSLIKDPMGALLLHFVVSVSFFVGNYSAYYHKNSQNYVTFWKSFFWFVLISKNENIKRWMF